ncbi:MAG: hypothetical protein KDN22_23250 [Verrucomicrobiae bacterium]|nr:hypothetical protein [Verrucomicrobiae bacterium]
MADQLDFNFDAPLPEAPCRTPSEPPASAGQNAQPPPVNLELFENSATEAEDGFERWRASNRKRNWAFAQKLGLPLGKNVEVTLHNGTVLRGPLQLEAASLKSARETGSSRDQRRQLRLSIYRADFSANEIASCIIIDE